MTGGRRVGWVGERGGGGSEGYWFGIFFVGEWRNEEG